MEKKVEIHNWKKHEIITLIKVYKSYPELWDVSNSKYKNRMKRRIAIHNIADVLNKSNAEVNRKLTNLRTQLFNENRKMERRKTLQGNDEHIQSSWEFYDALKFIDCGGEDSMQTQIKLDSISNFNISEESYHTEIADNDSSLLTKAEILQNEASLQASLNTLVTSPEITKPVTKRKSPKTPTRSRIEVIPEQDILLRNALYTMNNRFSDDHQIFGDYVASELRGLRSARYRKHLKRTIQKAILKISDMDDAHYGGHFSDSD